LKIIIPNQNQRVLALRKRTTPQTTNSTTLTDLIEEAAVEDGERTHGSYIDSLAARVPRKDATDYGAAGKKTSGDPDGTGCNAKRVHRRVWRVNVKHCHRRATIVVECTIFNKHRPRGILVHNLRKRDKDDGA
jgi:hypothetical protein